MTVASAYIGIGSNLGDRLANIERAEAEIAALGTLRRRSAIYRTRPWGNVKQPWFANAVVLLETELAPRHLLEGLHRAERRLGRTASERWAPRVIDLDLLLYDDRVIDEPDLQVPHPYLRERAFVLVPLASIDERFAAIRDALPTAELDGVAPYGQTRSVAAAGESDIPMPKQPQSAQSVSQRVRALAEFLSAGDAVRVRIERPDDSIELAMAIGHTRAAFPARDGKPAGFAPLKIDTIKADLVGIFHMSRPTLVEGDALEADRELGYIEALGIRTPVHCAAGGRLISIPASEGTPVEYGQPLFLVARGS